MGACLCERTTYMIYIHAGPLTEVCLSVTGFLPRIIKAAPSCAIMISTYEFGKSFFQRLNQEQPLGC